LALSLLLSPELSIAICHGDALRMHRTGKRSYTCLPRRTVLEVLLWLWCALYPLLLYGLIAGVVRVGLLIWRYGARLTRTVSSSDLELLR
jgi:hypothetical protein